MESVQVTTLRFPLCVLTLVGKPRGLAHVDFDAQGLERARENAGRYVRAPGEPADAVRFMRAYFAREDLPPVLLSPNGSPFEKRVWRLIAEIPLGATVSLEDLSRPMGGIRSMRRVAAAVMLNPLPIVVPCHRVLAADGALEYSGGAALKRSLLAHEGVRLMPPLTEDDAGE